MKNCNRFIRNSDLPEAMRIRDENGWIQKYPHQTSLGNHWNRGEALLKWVFALRNFGIGESGKKVIDLGTNNGCVPHVVADWGNETIAMDYITLLATSGLVEYKDENIIGRDLFVLAAQAMNITEIDTTNLLGGCGITATKDMGLAGLQTRKEFIDKCFENMYILVEDSNAYFDKLNVVNYYYAIHMSNKIDIMRVDETNIHTKPSLQVSKTNNTIENLSAKVDTTNLVNSYTITSKDDSNVTYKYEDADSISRHGLRSETTSSDITDYPLLVTTAQKFVDRNKEPSFNYSFTIRNADHLTLGELVEVVHPLNKRGIKLPISEYTLSFTNGLISNIVLGRKRLTLIETISKSI